MIRLAKNGGADAVKFQTYKAETLASRYSPAYWDLKKKKQIVNLGYLKNMINLVLMITKSYLNSAKK